MDHFAYIDAGTGSMFIQAIFGIGLASLVVLRTVVKRALAKIKSANRQKIVDEEA